MNTTNLLCDLQIAENLAKGSKLKRLFHSPINYVTAIAHRKLVYDKTKEGLLKSAQTFFNTRLQVMLPAGIDVFLTGAKTHDSEIRLARYLILQLKEGQTFLDIGPHFGYYSLLAATLVGKQGNVVAYEASKNTFKILENNVATFSQIKALHKAVSNNNEQTKFYEFPILFSEYNSSDITQYQHDEWFFKNKPTRVIVDSITLDELEVVPHVIKIDVEGAEQKVIEGGKTFLTQHSPIVIMEYLHPSRYNVSHRNALQLMKQYGYSVNIIEATGNINNCEDVEKHLTENNLESDNVVFVKL